MLIEQLKSMISSMPNLEKEVNNLLSINFVIENITVNSTGIEEFDYDCIEVMMEDRYDKTIILNSFKFNSTKKDQVSIVEFSSDDEVLYPGLKLNRNMIDNKIFKHQLFKGYDVIEVDSFLDIIASEYDFLDRYIFKNGKINELLKDNF